MVLKVSFLLQVPFRSYAMSHSLKETTLAGLKSNGGVFSLPKNMELCISIALKHIQLGNIIALPTDTIYGLAGNAQSTKAVERLYQIKSRDFCKPIAICVSEVSKMKQWGKIGHLSEDMLHELLPGPVTIVVNRTENLNSEFNPGIPKVAIRIPRNPFIQKLTSALDVPLALTSANKSNTTSTVTVDEFSALWNQLGAIFDGGKIGNNRAGSTIVDLSVPEKYEVIRKGSNFDGTIHILQKYGYSVF